MIEDQRGRRERVEGIFQSVILAKGSNAVGATVPTKPKT
jgi:hypothetical protein